MLQRADIQLRSIIKSLTDAVVPAIDPENSLATEQLQLALGILRMMQEQLPLSYAFDCNELARLIDLAGSITELGSNESTKRLQPLISSSKQLLGFAKNLDPADITVKVQEMRNEITEVTVGAYQSGADNTRSKLMKLVLNATSEQLLRERAWVLAQGWEDDPDSLPALESLLGLNPKPSVTL